MTSDSLRGFTESSRAVRASMRRFSETLIEIEELVALLRDVAGLLSEGDSARAIARVREVATAWGLTLH